MHPVLVIEPEMVRVSQVMNVTKEVDDLKEVVLRVMECAVSVSFSINFSCFSLINFCIYRNCELWSDYT